LLHAKLEFNTKHAEILAKSLMPDSLDWCKCFAKDGKFFIEIEAKKIGTVLYTIDDYLLNIKVVLETLNAIEK